MKKLILLIITLLISTSYARLGETVEECRKRYGAAKSLGEGDYLYKTKSGHTIGITFHKGKCVQISYFLKGGIQVGDVKDLLAKNCGDKLDFDYVGTRPDKKDIHIYQHKKKYRAFKGGTFLTIQDCAAIDAYQLARKKRTAGL